jgi:hypothetical protein
MKIGYAITSTIDQISGLDAQKRDLSEAGCERLFSNKFPASPTARSLHWRSTSFEPTMN